MSLTYRIKRLIRADLNAFVEDLEDPKGVLAQAIRDMEEELEGMEGAITAKESHLLKLKDGLKSCQESLEQLDHDIDFAISQKREEIAKSLIRKQLIAKETLETMLQEQKTCAEEHKRMEAEFRTRKRSYEEVKARSQHLNLPRSDDDVFACAERLVPVDSTLEHQVELEFLRRLQDRKEVSHGKETP